MSLEINANPPEMIEDAIAYTHQLMLSMEDESSRNIPNHDRFSVDKLEQLSQQLTLASATAKSLRNKLAPIYKLPPELLARVFYFYVEDAYDLDTPRMPPPPALVPPIIIAPGVWGAGAITPPAFTPTTPPLSSPSRSHPYDSRHPNRYLQVTRYFRDTVISSPHLWTRIRGGVETKYVDLSIERSGCAPLDIDLGTLSELGWGGYSTTGMSFLNATTLAGLHNFEHLEKVMSPETCARIRSLVLDSSRNRYSTNPGVLSVFAHPAPILESLVVSFALPISEGVLPQLFSGHTPSLRKLTISFYATWSGNAFTGLTHLTLLRQDVNREFMPTMQHVLNMLRESPALEELIMHSWGCSPVTADDDDDEADSTAVFYPLVQLKSLRIISVGYWISTLAAKQFMNHLVTPSSTVAYLYSYDLPLPVHPVAGDGDAVEIKFPLRHTMPAGFDQFEEGREGAGGMDEEGDAETRSEEERSGAGEENGQEDEGDANNGDNETNEDGENTEAVETVRQKMYSGEEESLFEEVRLFQAQNSMGCTSQTTITSGNVLQYCVTYGNPHLYLPTAFSLAHFTHLRTLWICREFGSSFRLSNWRTLYSGIPQLEKLVAWGVSADTILSPIALLSADGKLPHLNHIEVHFAKDLNDLVFSLKLCAQNRLQAGRKLSTVVIASLVSLSEQLQNELETQVSKLVGHLEYKVVHVCEEAFIAPMPPPGDDNNRLYFSPL